MPSETSIGPEESVPSKSVKTQVTTEGVDAQNTSQFELEHLSTAQDDPKQLSKPGGDENAQQISEINTSEKLAKPRKVGLAGMGE